MEQIPYNDALRFWQAVQFAGVIGKPLNSRADIQWRLAPSQLDVFTRRTRVLNALGNWLRRTAGKGIDRYAGDPAYVYAREISLGGHEHLHLAAYVPPKQFKAFEAVITKAVLADLDPDLAIARYPGDRSAVDCRPIKPGYLDLKRGVESYFLKEGDEATVSQWVEPNHARKAMGGTIYGKRLGVSRAIGLKARQNYRYGQDVDAKAYFPASEAIGQLN